MAEKNIEAVSSDGRKVQLHILIKRPLGKADGTYECEYDIVNLRNAKPRRCSGADSLTALAKAIRNVATELIWFSGIEVTVEKPLSDPALAVEPALTAMIACWREHRYSDAFEQSLPLAENGWFPAQYVAGVCYFYGNIMVPSLPKRPIIDLAINWLSEAASAGEPSACDNLSLLYLTSGVDWYDAGKAEHYRQLAKEYGWPY